MKKAKPVQGVYVICRCCSLEYIEEQEWINYYPRITECPLCGHRVSLD